MTNSKLTNAIKAIARGEELGDADLEGAFDAMLAGDALPEEIGALLMGLAVRGETEAELLAGARAMRSASRKLDVAGPVLDTCGTGGLPWTSLNTSTAAAIVIAAAGGRVAKHGNRSVPPKTGSADVLEALGVNIDISEETFHACLEGAGVAFMFARSHHAAAAHVAPVRKQLGIRTIFNLLGPLTNPAGAQHQILGVSQPHWVLPMAQTLAKLGTTHSWVVHGADGIDEISISGTTHIAEIKGDTVRQFDITPETFDLPTHALTALAGGAPKDNAAAITALLDGQSGAFRDIVTLNAAAGLHIFGNATDLQTGISMAQTAIDSGKAKATLSALAALSNGQMS